MSHSLTRPCPYCGTATPITLADNFAPIYNHCGHCHKKFIVERLSKGFQVLTLEAAPCESNPDCIALETGSSDEQ